MVELLDLPCPGCQRRGILYVMTTLDVPYFGPTVETLLQCPECGFRHVDVLTTQEREPARVTFPIAAEEDMLVRVVRSASCTIRVPELGVLVEPGMFAEAFVSNVEGLLARVERIVRVLHRDAEDEASRRRAQRLLDRLARVRAGKERATLVLEDPFGNSAVVSDRARREALPPEEAARLKPGMSILELRPGASPGGREEEEERGEGPGGSRASSGPA